MSGIGVVNCNHTPHPEILHMECTFLDPLQCQHYIRIHLAHTCIAAQSCTDSVVIERATNPSLAWLVVTVFLDNWDGRKMGFCKTFDLQLMLMLYTI